MLNILRRLHDLVIDELSQLDEDTDSFLVLPMPVVNKIALKFGLDQLQALIDEWEEDNQ